MSAFTRLAYWFWGSTQNHETPNSPSLNSSTNFLSGFRDPDSTNSPSLNNRNTINFSPRKIKRRNTREERRIDKEYNLVLVPSDGECMSGSESDDSDWSIGWLEPHGADFERGSDDKDCNFAVLVPCYRHGNNALQDGSSVNHQIFGAADPTFERITEGKNYIEQWLSSLPTPSITDRFELSNTNL